MNFAHIKTQTQNPEDDFQQNSSKYERDTDVLCSSETKTSN